MATPFLTDLSSERIAEKTRQRLDFIVRDELKAVIPGASLDFVKLTLYDEATGADINSRTAVDVLASGELTVSALGVGVMTFEPDDNVIVGAAPVPSQEIHVAQFDYQWDADVLKVGRHLVRLQVVNLLKTT